MLDSVRMSPEFLPRQLLLFFLQAMNLDSVVESEIRVFIGGSPCNITSVSENEVHTIAKLIEVI